MSLSLPTLLLPLIENKCTHIFLIIFRENESYTTNSRGNITISTSTWKISCNKTTCSKQNIQQRKKNERGVTGKLWTFIKNPEFIQNPEPLRITQKHLLCFKILYEYKINFKNFVIYICLIHFQ